MKFTGTLSVPKFDLSGYQEALHKQLTAAIQQAAREWLNATAGMIPVWSGASVGTFLKLAGEAGYPLSIQPVTRKDRIEMGVGASDGTLVADPKGIYSFSYSTSLAHLIFNEYQNANLGGDPKVFARLHQPGPYHFQEHGLAAFNASAARVRLPDVRQYIMVQSKQVG